MPDPCESLGEPRIVLEGADFLVVSKPARLHSVPLLAGGSDRPPCLCDWVFARFPDAGPDGMAGIGDSHEERAIPGGASRLAVEGGLLHRLDFETSGLVLFARNPAAFRFLLAAQSAGAFSKDYLASATLTDGLSPFPEGSSPPRSSPSGIEAEAWEDSLHRRDLDGLVRLLSRDSAVESRFRSFGPAGARVACVAVESAAQELPMSRKERLRASAPVYRTEFHGASRAEDGLLLRVRLSKGFRHQVRAQLAWIGLPIAGDPLYGGAPSSRLGLHASRLEFPSPRGGSAIVVEEDPNSIRFA